jgi:hypothetical protein
MTYFIRLTNQIINLDSVEQIDMQDPDILKVNFTSGRFTFIRGDDIPLLLDKLEADMGLLTSFESQVVASFPETA